MPSNYQSISAENLEDYGKKIADYGRRLFLNQYANRTHFIFELLQNAEDAYRRREAPHPRPFVQFDLDGTRLRVSHHGAPFTEKDVRGICAIGESTKGPNEIGQFGIGFKAVYQFTDCPHVQSGEESFCIERFVHPRPVDRLGPIDDATLFTIPFRIGDDKAFLEIRKGLLQLGSQTLLFLNQIVEIRWQCSDGTGGRYTRDETSALGGRALNVRLRELQDGSNPIVQDWLIFRKFPHDQSGQKSGHLAIAFLLSEAGDTTEFQIASVPTSPLSVFFATAIETNLGFLIQAPFRTTPSRDNIPFPDEWNESLIDELAALLIEALGVLRDVRLLNGGVLSTLPLMEIKFAAGSLLRPFFDAVQMALRSLPLLPKFPEGYISGENATFAGSTDLRELIDSSQLTSLVPLNTDAETGIFIWHLGSVANGYTCDQPTAKRRTSKDEKCGALACASPCRDNGHSPVGDDPLGSCRNLSEFGCCSRHRYSRVLLRSGVKRTFKEIDCEIVSLSRESFSAMQAWMFHP